MRYHSLNIIVLLIISGLLFQGCKKDEAISEDFIQAANENPTGNANNDRPQNGNNVANLDHDVVYEWTQLMLEIERYAEGMRPNASARAFAYIYLASYETAVPGMRDHRSNVQRLDGLRIDQRERARSIDWEIALNTCFARTMDHFIYNIPSNLSAKIGELETELESDFSANLSQNTIENSQEWGAYVANQIIEYSQTDEAAEAQILEPQPTSYEPPIGLGFWTYSADPERALFPYWGSVRTFVITPDETSTVPPLTYSEDENSPYFADMMECYTVNNTAKAEDNEQLWIAEFWSDDVENLMFSPPARQYAISNQLIQQFDLDLAKTLTLYAKLGFSLNDAAVATWKYKYEYMVMRPNVFIHEFIDPDFQTNLFRLIYWPNPSFPGYPSGHSTFASAGAGLFVEYFGDAITFTDRSHEGRTEFRSAPRTYNSLRKMAEENAYSRIPLGVHMRMDCREGLRLGYEISDAVNGLNLERRDELLAGTGN